jgi:ABC-type transport system involved in multi-copper enzyme maturation permease subunit
MAVYKRNYRAYAGPITPVGWRWLAITRFGLDEVFSQRHMLAAFVFCLMPPLIAASLIYVVNSETVRALLNLRGAPPFSINNNFFLSMLEVQGWLALFVSAWVGPSLISPDLANNALPLYLSRPVSRARYVAGKLLILALLLSAITWAPILLLVGVQAATAPGRWLVPNLYMVPAIFLGACVWIAMLSLLTLAVSAWVKWRVVAVGLMFAIIFIPAGFGGVVSAVLRTKWGLLLNIPYVITRVWVQLLRVTISHTRLGGQPVDAFGVPAWTAWVVLAAVCLASVLLLNMRIQARQVVRG